MENVEKLETLAIKIKKRKKSIEKKNSEKEVFTEK
jgi:hypothetical protein